MSAVPRERIAVESVQLCFSIVAIAHNLQQQASP
jgi:hypothetical protein